jgi:hypothetical protein
LAVGRRSAGLPARKWTPGAWRTRRRQRNRPGSRPCWFVHLGSPQTYPPSLWISAAASRPDRPR